MNYYLNADTGNDSTGDGSSSSPWLTLSKAHTSASDGDTIICQESTATYSFVNQIFTKDLKVEGVNDDASGVVFDGGGIASRWYANRSTTVAYEVRKITFQNIQTPGAGQYMCIIGCMHLVAENNVFRNIKSGSSNGSTGSAGIVGTEYLSGANDHAVLIQNNLFYDLNGGNTTLYISLHTNGGNDTGYVYWYGNTVIATNTYTTPNFFVVSTIGSLDFQIKNNVFYTDSSVAMVASGSALNGYFDNNLTFNCTNVPTGTDNITDDPLFVDAPNDNYNLRPTSPCFKAGVLV